MDVRRIHFYPLRYFMTERQQRILDALYGSCQDRSLTSENIMLKVLGELNLLTDSINRVTLLDIIRKYKQTSKNLEQTIKDVECVLYPVSVTFAPEYNRSDD